MIETLDKKLHAAIDKLSDEQKKAVFGIVRVFTSEKRIAPGHWEDENFVEEMEDRYREYKSGKAKLISLDEVEKKARAAAQKLKSKKAS